MLSRPQAEAVRALAASPTLRQKTGVRNMGAPLRPRIAGGGRSSGCQRHQAWFAARPWPSTVGGGAGQAHEIRGFIHRKTGVEAQFCGPRRSAALEDAKDQPQENASRIGPELARQPVIGLFLLGRQIDRRCAGSIRAANDRFPRLGLHDKASTAMRTYQTHVAVRKHTQPLAGLWAREADQDLHPQAESCVSGEDRSDAQQILPRLTLENAVSAIS